MIRLTDEEILEATGIERNSSHLRVRDAQLKKVSDAIGDVLDEPDDKLRLALGYAWQALLKEIE